MSSTASTGAFVAGLIIASLVWFIFCVIAIADISSSYQKEAVEQGVARYNPQSGSWEWYVEKGDE